MALSSVSNNTTQPTLGMAPAEKNPIQQARTVAEATEQLLQTLPVKMKEAFLLISQNLEKLPSSHPVNELKKGLVLLTGEFAKLAGFSPELSTIFESFHRPEGSGVSQAEKKVAKKAATEILDVVSTLNQKIVGNLPPLRPLASVEIAVDQHPKNPEFIEGKFICRHFEEI